MSEDSPPIPPKPGFRKAAVRKGGRRRPAKRNVSALLQTEEVVKEKTHFTEVIEHVKTESGSSTFVMIDHPSNSSNLDSAEVEDTSNIHGFVVKKEKEEETEGEEDSGGIPFIEKSTKYAPGKVKRMNELLRDPEYGFTPLVTEKKFLDSVKDSKNLHDRIKMKVVELGPKPGEQYVSPRVEVEFPTKLMKNKRLWEINLFDRKFVELKRVDCVIKGTIPIEILTKVETVPEENVIILRFRPPKGKKKPPKPRRITCTSKDIMWKLYELCKFSMIELPCWIPELLSGRQKVEKHGIKKVTLNGQIGYLVKKSGQKQPAFEKKNIDGTQFLVGTQFERMCLFCVSWNVKGAKMLPKTEKGKDFIFKQLILPGANMYAICLQGLSGKMFGKQGSALKYVDGFFKRQFDGKFVLVNGTRCHDVGLFIFIEGKYSRRISKIYWTKKAFPKSLGESGSMTVRMQMNESSITFMGVSLPDNSKMKTKIYEELFTDENLEVSDHHVFILGDFGYTLHISPDMAISYANRKKSLMEYDDFLTHKRETGLLSSFREAEILFPPNSPIEGKPGKECTFQVAPPTKKKGPDPHLGYTSRILSKSYPGVECRPVAYNSIRTLGFASPSAPVYCVYAVDSLRTHVELFAEKHKRKEIKILDMMVCGGSTTGFRSPHIVLEGDWLEVTPVTSSTKTVQGGRNPRFNDSNFLAPLHPVKSTETFLKSVHLMITLRDEKEKEPIRGFGVLSIGEALRNEGWFSIPIVLKTRMVCKIMGMIEIVDRVEVEV